MAGGGLAGVFLSAQTGSGDPLVGNPLLLSLFAAVVVGGTRRHAQTLRYALPAVVCLLLVLVVTQWTLGRSLTHWGYWNALIVLSSFLAILALGQGAVILTGGLDLSALDHRPVGHPVRGHDAGHGRGHAGRAGGGVAAV